MLYGIVHIKAANTLHAFQYMNSILMGQALTPCVKSGLLDDKQKHSYNCIYMPAPHCIL